MKQESPKKEFKEEKNIDQDICEYKEIHIRVARQCNKTKFKYKTAIIDTSIPLEERLKKL